MLQQAGAGDVARDRPARRQRLDDGVAADARQFWTHVAYHAEAHPRGIVAHEKMTAAQAYLSRQYLSTHLDRKLKLFSSTTALRDCAIFARQRNGNHSQVRG